MKKLILATVLIMSTCLPLSADEGGGDIYYDKPVIGVLFSHDVHVEDAGLDCESCHDDLFQMEARLVQEEPDFNMQALAEGRYCGACHDGDMAFSSNTRCATCHIGVIGYNRALGLEKTGSQH